MSRRLAVVSMDDTVKIASERFNQRGIHHLLVIEKGRLVGVVSDRDVLINTSPFIGQPHGESDRDRATLKRRVHQIMSHKVKTIAPTASVIDAATTLLSEKISCLPVVTDEGKPVGIVTIRGLLQWMVEHASVVTA